MNSKMKEAEWKIGLNESEKYQLVDRLSSDLIVSTEDIQELQKIINELNVEIGELRHPIKYFLKKVYRKLKRK